MGEWEICGYLGAGVIDMIIGKCYIVEAAPGFKFYAKYKDHEGLKVYELLQDFLDNKSGENFSAEGFATPKEMTGEQGALLALGGDLPNET